LLSLWRQSVPRQNCLLQCWGVRAHFAIVQRSRLTGIDVDVFVVAHAELRRRLSCSSEKRTAVVCSGSAQHFIRSVFERQNIYGRLIKSLFLWPLGHVRRHLIFVCHVNALFFGDETLTNNLVLRSSPRKLLILLEATPGIEPG
jgi:hypothetical protein